MIYPIHVYGSPVLHKVCAPVTEFDDDLKRLVEDMYETTVAAPGVGLAAPQIGLDKAMFVWVYADHDGPERGVAINPILLIEPIDTEEPGEEDTEGCLSFPGYPFPLRRSPHALLQAQDENGDWYKLEAEGWFARILQHEYDHLHGRIFVDRLQGKRAKRVAQIMKAEKWGVPGVEWTPGVDSPYEDSEEA